MFKDIPQESNDFSVAHLLSSYYVDFQRVAYLSSHMLPKIIFKEYTPSSGCKSNCTGKWDSCIVEIIYFCPDNHSFLNLTKKFWILETRQVYNHSIKLENNH